MSRKFTLISVSALALGLLTVALFNRPSHAAASNILVSAVYYDTYLANEPDEAIRLTNVSSSTIALSNWTMMVSSGVITLTGNLDPGTSFWIAQQAMSFTLEFGFSPAFEYGADSDPSVPDLLTSGNVTLDNTGGALVLNDDQAMLVDSVVWENGNATGTGWLGASISPYDQGFFGLEGQILYRKIDQATGRPASDTDTRADWAQATDDDVNGKKVLYPGWDLDRYFATAKFTETATLTYTIAPDNIFLTVQQAISAATTSITYEGYDFNNAELGLALAARASTGVSVTLLLEGAPVGGLTDQERWICQQIENAGGACWFMVNDSSVTPPLHDRYAYQHAKFMVIDGRWLLTGSENLNYTSMPSDDKSDGTAGNRGIWLWTDAPGPIAHAQDIFAHDFDPGHHRDLKHWSAADPQYGAPPGGFSPDFGSGGTSYPVQFPTPVIITGNVEFELVQAPDNALRDSDALLGMVARAGNGDSVLVEQLYEYTYWGPTASNPASDPNPRLEAYIAAARRGATVRLLLDSAYDDPLAPRGNSATCAYVNSLAASEQLDLVCLLGNPTGTGIHNKMVLLTSSGQGWVHTGSLNGSENSNKQNRELVVQVKSTIAYNALAEMFWYDWTASGGILPTDHFLYLPLIARQGTPTPTATSTPTPTATSTPPAPANLQITTLSGTTTPEYVTIQNLGGSAQDLTGWALVSVVGPQTYNFPAGFTLAPNATVQIQSYTGAVNNPPAILFWTTSAIWNNAGDKAELRNNVGTLVSSACYGNACP